MRRYQFDKLVRSKIPPRMKDEGVVINSNSLSKSDYLFQLKKKIIEGAKEVYDTNSKTDLIIELSDVMEVIHTIAKENQISLHEIGIAQAKKREINGHFSRENYINYIDVSEDNLKVIEYLENKNRPYKLQK